MWNEKIINIGKIKELLDDGYEIEVDSPDGWVGVNYFIDKGDYQEYILHMENGMPSVRCNADHLFETSLGWVSARELAGKESVNVLTRNGYSNGYVIVTDDIIPIVDINVLDTTLPDILLVLPWNLSIEIKSQFSSYLKSEMKTIRAIPKVEYF